jgi:hypothetical protein
MRINKNKWNTGKTIEAATELITTYNIELSKIYRFVAGKKFKTVIVFKTFQKGRFLYLF